MQLISYLDSNNDGEIDSLEWTIRLNETLSFEFEMEDFRKDVSEMVVEICFDCGGNVMDGL